MQKDKVIQTQNNDSIMKNDESVDYGCAGTFVVMVLAAMFIIFFLCASCI